MIFTLTYDTDSPLALAIASDAAAWLVDHHEDMTTYTATVMLRVDTETIRVWHANEN